MRADDVQRMFDYITEIGNEDTFIFINPEAMETLESEEKYIKDCVKKMADKEMVKLLAFEGETLVGVVDVTKLTRRQKHVGQLGVSVLKSHRGDGIGKQLMQLAIKRAQQDMGVSQIVLGCFANNDVGLGLYGKLGFKEYGRWPKGVLYKDDYIDEILMYKDLS